MLNQKRVREILDRKMAWAKGHGVNDSSLGFGLMYYTITYALAARVAVCLGSGGGLVPLLMKEAQRDLGIKYSRTILIDANNGEWGSPVWLPSDSTLRQDYPDIEFWIMTTDDAVERLGDTSTFINYCHIDANHSYEQARADFDNYSQMLVNGGVITMHDTKTACGVPRVIAEIREMPEWDVVDFHEIGAGIALLKRSC